jgi:hypothetical protein
MRGKWPRAKLSKIVPSWPSPDLIRGSVPAIPIL